MLYVTPFVTSLVNAVKKAASYLDRDFNEIEQLQNSVRGSKDFVFNSYTRLEKRLREELGKIKPDTAIFTPSDKIAGKTYFAVSPIEGILNYAHGNPNFAVSLAYIENGEILVGIVYNPARDELYFAAKGNGAYKEGSRNHERLRVSSFKELDGAAVSATSSYVEKRTEAADLHYKIMQKTGSLHISGCLAQDLAYLASGKIEASLSLNNHICAMAAGILLVKEAGGSVRAFNQKDIRIENLAEIFSSGTLAATNFNLNQKIFEIFK